MEVKVAEYAGFCPGVKRAVDKTLEEVKKGEKIYCYGELVHNKQVIDELQEYGAETVEKLEDVPDGSKVIFRAHGVKKSDYEIANRKNLNVIDLTCGKVKIIHDTVFSKKDNNFIIIIGDEQHPENIGTKDFAGENSIVISSSDEIIDAYQKYEESNLKSVYVVSQTTFNLEKFNEITSEIEENFCETQVIIDNTICNTTKLRQNEVEILAKKMDIIIVVGGKNSANTNKLAEIAKKFCKNVYHIQTKEDLNDIKLNEEKIGIVAGASTPKKIVEEIEENLKKR